MTSPFSVFDHAKFVSLTTRRRSGESVPTPVWAVVEEGDVWVVSRGPGKVKRIANDPAVTLALCSMQGRVTGQPVAGRAAIVGTEIPREIRRRLLRKYGPFGALALGAARLAPKARKPVVLRISPASPA
jgi:PPOX class probable F420-dependent enzyme